MEKIRNITNRLSSSADKLHSNESNNPSSPQLGHLGSAPLSEGNIPSSILVGSRPCRPKRNRIKAGCSHSFSADEVASSSSSRYRNGRDISEGEDDNVSCSTSLRPNNRSIDSFSLVLSRANPANLVEEVLIEIDKLREKDNEREPKQRKNETRKNEICNKKNLAPTTSKTGIIDGPNSSHSRAVKKVDESERSPSSTWKTGSLSPACFSDYSTSEDIVTPEVVERDQRLDTVSPIIQPVNSTVTVEKSAKKESIYNRLIKSTKRDALSPTKEPVYAKIKRKGKPTDRDFKPIEPILGKAISVNAELVKPEPLYNKQDVKPNGLEKSNFTPYNHCILSLSSDSSFISVNSKVNSVPTESAQSKVKRASSDCSHNEVKDSIINKPLPSIPKQPRPSSYRSTSGKVTVKAKETIYPSKASIITISNPAFAKTDPTYDSSKAIPPSSSHQSVASSLNESSACQSNNTHGKEHDVGSSGALDQSKVTSQNEIAEDEVSAKLSRLAEELAQGLKSINQGSSVPISKAEMLKDILSTYDVPKNLRPIEAATEEDIKWAKQALLPLSSFGDELGLRYVDDNENMETIYADVPDFSQDEFVIALDDENDPKYSFLTREMLYKNKRESPGKVSRKSAQVYVNVINVLSALKVLINSNSSKAATVISRMGTLARPYAQRVQTSIGDNTWIQKKLHRKSGHNGFDELRKYIKSGGEFCKEVALIMHERAELEATYAKGLQKLSVKLVKASREVVTTTTSEAWQTVGEEMDQEGDIHRILAAALTDEVVKPIRQLIETQHKVRKGVESMVDKTAKNLHDWRTAEAKAKKNCYHNSRENEKVQDMVIEARLGRGKILSDKDIIKLEKQRKKAEEAVHKSDIEYYSYCIRTERARQEWELAVYKGSGCFQIMEEERLAALKELVKKYQSHKKEVAPKLMSCFARLDEPVKACDVEKDIQTVIANKGSAESIPEQTLPDFFSEDMNNVMNKARRRDALENFLKLIRNDLDRERRGKQGVENLAKALQETPNFGSEDSQQDVNDKLQNAMLAYLEAARYKVQSTLDEVNDRPKSSHPLAKHIETYKDKAGFPISILRVPPWVKSNSTDVSPISNSPGGSPDWNDRGTADGNSVQPDSDFDEFSSQGSEQEYHPGATEGQNHPNTTEDKLDSGTGSDPPDGTYYARPMTTTIGRCKALYDYEANMYDELSIRTGDIINVHEKQPDGWWVGELEGSVGIFPATYVEETECPA